MFIKDLAKIVGREETKIEAVLTNEAALVCPHCGAPTETYSKDTPESKNITYKIFDESRVDGDTLRDGLTTIQADSVLLKSQCEKCGKLWYMAQSIMMGTPLTFDEGKGLVLWTNFVCHNFVSNCEQLNLYNITVNGKVAGFLMECRNADLRCEKALEYNPIEYTQQLEAGIDHPILKNTVFEWYSLPMACKVDLPGKIGMCNGHHGSGEQFQAWRDAEIIVNNICKAIHKQLYKG